MNSINQDDVIRCRVTLRNPITVESLPLLSRLDRAARRKRRGLGKRIIGKPAQHLFRQLAAGSTPSVGRLRIETAKGMRRVEFNARNTQFSALYIPEFKPFYEAELCTIFDRLIGSKDTFYDIGANWGWHSIMVAARPKFEGNVHAFEPFPSTFGDLSSIVKGAELTTITCHDIALADTDGSATMEIPGGMHSGGASLRENGNGVSVRLARLDSLDLPAPKAMKIDVEDHEIQVMQGGQKLIEKERPFIVFENWAQKSNPNAAFAPIDFLVRSGYALYYPGWVIENSNCVVSHYAGTNEFALVPFLPVHRFQLGDLINIVAAPKERADEFRRAFS